MGQLEKYGLYVLVVVIVLILGVAIWGDGRTEPDDVLLAGGDGVAPALTDLDYGRRAGVDAPYEPTRDPAAGPNGGAGGALPLDDLIVTPPGPGVEGAPPGGGGTTPPQPEPEPQPAPSGPQDYEVQSGDNPTKIVKRFGGTDADVPAFLAANPGLNPRRMKAGDKVVVPSFGASRSPALERREGGPVETQEAPRALPATYVVKAGDTPGGISSKLYGTSRHWRKLLEYNGLTEADAKALPLNTQLRVPRIADSRD